MNCEQFERDIHLFLEAKLDDEELDAFSNHAASCERCEKRLIEEYKIHNEVKDAMDSLDQGSPALSKLLSQLAGQIMKGLEGEELIQGLEGAFDDFKKKLAREIPAEDLDLYVKSVYLEAEQYIEEGKPENAIKCLRAAHELRPEDLQVRSKLDELNEIERERKDQASKRKLENLISKIRQLKKEVSLLCTVARDLDRSGVPVLPALEIDRSRRNRFKLGEKITICVEMPLEKDGYLTVFHYDEENNIKMVFPSKPIHLTFFKGSEEKSLKIEVSEPLGRHYIKAIWTSQQLFKHDSINFDTPSSITSSIAGFIETIYTVKEDEWMESVVEFEVSDR